ncbi:MAG: threonine synthase [Candidatus Bathyarchaeia archaeon]
MSYVTKLKCAKCGKEYSLKDKAVMCKNRDDGRLNIYYNYEALKNVLSKKELKKRPLSVWKYKELLPILHEENIVSLNEGGTPLIKSKRLSKHLNLKSLYLKDETRNPTASFKDRTMTVGVSKALEFGVTNVVTASSGNAAAALSAYSANAGLNTYAFVLEAATLGKIAQLMLCGAKVIKFKGLEKGVDPTVKMLKEVHENYGWYPCPSFGPFNPYQFEGAKTIAYEIVEQLGWKSPEWVIIPVGAGGLLAGNWKGFKEYETLGFIEETPKIAAIQSEGCAPLVRAFKKGVSPFEIEPWESPKTVATGLMDPFPWDGDAALLAIRESKGIAETVSDSEILEAQKLLAKIEGIFAEPSGVTSLAGLIKLLDLGVIDRNEVIVVEITGSGLKDPEIALRMFKEPPTIAPSLEELKKVITI